MPLAHTTLATLNYHDPHCSGCPACSEDHAALLSMAPQEYSRWLAADTRALRSASTFRVSQPEDPPSPPDGYADALAKRGAPKPVCPYDDSQYSRTNPPNSYEIAVERLKKGQER
jgi:hypothetical protein